MRAWMIQVLTLLARAIAGRAQVSVDAVSGGVWACDGDCIVGNIADIEAEDCRRALAMTAHEAAHAAITRSMGSPPELTLAEMAACHMLLNSLEEGRTQRWLARDFRGAARWVAAVNASLLRDLQTQELSLPAQFCVAAVAEHAIYHHLSEVAEPVARALVRTHLARARYMEFLPPRSASDNTALYRSLGLPAVYVNEQQFPSAEEMAVRCCSVEAQRLALTEIWPVFKELYEKSKDEKSPQTERKAPAGDGHEEPPASEEYPTGPTLEELLRSARVSAERRQSSGRPRRGDGTGRSAPSPEPTPEELSYEKALDGVQPILSSLIEELRRSLPEREQPIWTPGWDSGKRLDLRKAMAWVARPRGAAEGLWQRRSWVRAWEPAVLLMVDLSGSMRGPKIRAAFEASVLVAEALEALGIAFGVYGFQDILLPIKPLSGSPAPLCDSRAALTGMMSEVEDRGVHNRAKYNDDGSCLACAAAILEGFPATHRVLIVLSDGHPEGLNGPERSRALLHQSIGEIRAATDIHLIGLGIGPGTDHVSQFYDHARGSVPLGKLPEVLGQLLRDALGLGR